MDRKLQTTSSHWTRYMVKLSQVYTVGIIAWALFQTFLRDRWWWLYATNVISVYLFLLLLPQILLALWARQKNIWISFSIVLVIGIYSFGELFVPSLPAQVPSESIILMTSNVMVARGHPEEVIASIRKADADIVAIQELTTIIANALQQELSAEYPYQILEACDNCVIGLGLLSKYPLSPVDLKFSESWLGNPQVVEIDFNGDSLMVINFHATPPGRSLKDPYHSITTREDQVREMVAFIEGQDIPVIALGDLNATDQNMAYKMMTASMGDAWRERGFGLGNTYQNLWGFSHPKWFVRIDYIFYTLELETIAARVGPWDGYSDHRPVVAELALGDREESP